MARTSRRWPPLRHRLWQSTEKGYLRFSVANSLENLKHSAGEDLKEWGGKEFAVESGAPGVPGPAVELAGRARRPSLHRMTEFCRVFLGVLRVSAVKKPTARTGNIVTRHPDPYRAH